MLKIKIFFAILFFLVLPAIAQGGENIKGRIVIDVENKGEAWYISPDDFHRYHLGTKENAWAVVGGLARSRELPSIPDRQPGEFYRPGNGKVYYVHPADSGLMEMDDADDLYQIMRYYSLGISTAGLQPIPIGKINTDGTHSWEYLGWWGRIKAGDAPVSKTPGGEMIGKLKKNNRIKVLGETEIGGKRWLELDGGQYPGAFIEAQSVEPVPQPVPARPDPDKNGPWIDVDLKKMVLTLLDKGRPVFATYVSVGTARNPTITGTYSVFLKYKVKGMSGEDYFLRNVPYIMYYRGLYSLHGTYWHDEFGTRKSHGCTNLTQGDARFLFDYTAPELKAGNWVRASGGTPVYNHY